MRHSAFKTLALATLALPLAALAHTGADAGLHHGLVAGFMHPLTGVDHLAAMVAVGLWSALAARRAWPDLLWAPLAFAGMLLVGALMGLAGLQLPAVEPMIAASLLVLGLLVATRAHLPAGVQLPGRWARNASGRDAPSVQCRSTGPAISSASMASATSRWRAARANWKTFGPSQSNPIQRMPFRMAATASAASQAWVTRA